MKCRPGSFILSCHLSLSSCFVVLGDDRCRVRENFGRGAGASMASDEPGGGGSLFLMELQGALAALQADHFGRIAALRIPCVQVRVRKLLTVCVYGAEQRVVRYCLTQVEIAWPVRLQWDWWCSVVCSRGRIHPDFLFTGMSFFFINS